MLVDEKEEWKNRSPESFGGSPLSLMVYVGDADQMFQQALAAGATEKEPVKDPFYGHRSGTLTDPFGHVWTIGTHKEDVSEEELQRRWQQMVQAEQG